MRISTVSCGFVVAIFVLGIVAGESRSEVMIRQSGGTLRVTGDNYADVVIINGNGSNQVIIEANDGEIFEYENVQHLRIDLRRGADELEIYDLEISGNLDVNLGGDFGDTFQMTDSLIGGNFTCKGASDSLFVDSSIGRNLNVQAGQPFDFFENGCTMEWTTGYVGGQATLRGSNQSIDLVCVRDSFFANNLNINLGGGADELCILDNFIGRNLTMDGGRGIDLVSSIGNLIGGRITLRNFQLFF